MKRYPVSHTDSQAINFSRVENLIAFFDSGITPSVKPVLITFDDAYEDFYRNAYPYGLDNPVYKTKI